MIQLSQYIIEKIQKLKQNIKGIIVFDIDDTLLRVDTNIMRVYKKEPGKKEIALTTSEFAKDPDVESHIEWFDYRDFNDPIKVYTSIINGTPLIRNLRIMDDYIEAGYEFCFLTARSQEEMVKKALDDFLEHKSNEGEFKKLGDIFNKAMSHAINDNIKKYPGKSDSEKKSNVLKKLCSEYDKVVFVDDDKKNVKAAKGLNIDNLVVIKAWD